MGLPRNGQARPRMRRMALMSKLYKLRNLGPAPSDEELASMLTSYMLSYGDHYDIMDNSESGQTPEDYVYGESLNTVCNDPRQALTFVVSELDEYGNDPIDAGQVPMLNRLRDSIKAYIAVRGE